MGNSWSEEQSTPREAKLALLATGLVAGAVSYFLLSRKNEPEEHSSMFGRVCVVTGANVGIGKATAIALAAKGATVVLGCRNVENGQAAAREIAERTKNDSVMVKHLDLADLSSVKRFVDDVQRQNLKVHVLINNAGAMNPELSLVHGIERSFFANHLGPFYLTHLLLPNLKAASEASGFQSRIVNVSSRLEKRAKLDLDSLDGSQGYDMWQAYSNSKLCNLLFTYELHRRLAAAQTQKHGAEESKAMPVTVNAVTPGIVNSSLGRHAPSILQWLSAPLRYLLMRTPQKGAETVVFVASNEAANNISGKYWADCKPIESSAQSHDEQLAKALWQKSEELVKQVTTRQMS